MTDRIYLVKNGTDNARLIEAANKNAALSYAVKTSIKVELATQRELVELTNDGIQVEIAAKAV